MKAICLRSHGGPEVLAVEERPEPSGPVRVLVTHVGLNHLDLWVRRGVPGHRFPLPIVPGSDVVGIRVDTGERVALQPGLGCGRCGRCLSGRHDLCRAYRIRGETMDGGMCELVGVSEAELLPCPMEPSLAAAAPLSLLTAWHMLVSRARVSPGDRVLVQAGASGVGIYAIQVARLFGARVAATASTPEKRALCRELGAEVAWDYPEAVPESRSWTRKEGFDLVVDHVGQDTFEASIQMLRWGGSYATCGATSGHLPTLNLRLLFFKQLTLLGSTMGSMGEMTEAWRHLLSGAIRPVVHAVGAMSRLGEAHGWLEGRGVAGKVVVEQNLA
jgi:NADPH:quinone reductase-like Zn-dependent oxidoreductase